MSERAIKTGWHLLLVAAALLEFRMAKTPLRRCLVGACAGWHAAAAYDDAFAGGDADEKETRKRL